MALITNKLFYPKINYLFNRHNTVNRFVETQTQLKFTRLSYQVIPGTVPEELISLI